MVNLFLCYLVGVYQLSVASAQDCPSQCSCHSDASQVIAHCSNSHLSDVPSQLPVSLTVLDVSQNPNISFSAMKFLPNLVRLDARYCNMTDIPKELMQSTPNLKELELGHNSIKAIPESVQKLSHLESLSLGHNNITRLENNCLHNINLDQLDLQHNPLSFIQQYTFENASITTLSMDFTSIGDALMALSYTPFKMLSSSLKHLFWSHSNKELKLSPNTFAGLHLDHLQLTNNGLYHLSFLQTGVNIKNLDISHNMFTSLDITCCPGLEKTTSAKFRNCSINIFYCSDTKKQLSLEVLDLSINEITDLNIKIAQVLPKLKILKLAGNPLTVLSSELKPYFFTLVLLDVTNTSIACDCRNKWLLGLESIGHTVSGLTCKGLAKTQIKPFSCLAPYDVSLDHTNANLTCSATGIPVPAIQWKCTTINGLISLANWTWSVEYNKYIYKTNSTISPEVFESTCTEVVCIAKNFKGTVEVTHSIPRVQWKSHLTPDKENIISITVFVVCAVLFLLLCAAIVYLLRKKSVSSAFLKKHMKSNKLDCDVENDSHLQFLIR